jgi:L-ascorbate metabolism protein UlaG (beta-lactamase superfamily)
VLGAVGDTTGFLLEWEGQKNGALYQSGDSVWFDGLLDIPKRYKIGTCIIHMGAANVPAAGDNRLTMNAEEGVRIAQETGAQAVFPAHFEGWAHYKQGRGEVERIFREAGLNDQLRLLNPGETAEVLV